MKRIPLRYLVLTLLLSAANILYAQQSSVFPKNREKAVIKVPAKKFHLYLLAGQSNMAGRGIVAPQDTVGDPRILALNRDGEWEIAKDPVHFDKTAAGVGPGLSFAREMIKHDPDIVIGLIPCAAGGSGMDHWLNDHFWEQTRSYPWNNAIVRTRLAMKDGVLKGVLWHQGEADTAPEKAAAYSNNLVQLVTKFRQAFHTPDLPFVAGELPDFNKGSAAVNPTIYDAAKSLSFFTVVSGKGFTPLADGVHIDAASQRMFGKRYAEAMGSLRKK
ncbi:sialate O-acetylesterase [Chitinophaga barathri]|nr:sialate O-acetylesterase [Chitinophaga barathri]